MDTNRADLVRVLVTREPGWREARARLGAYAWDSHDRVRFTNAPVIDALLSFVAGKAEAAELATWAEMIEAREDVEFADPIATKVIFELANPEIHLEFDESRARDLLQALGFREETGDTWA